MKELRRGSTISRRTSKEHSIRSFGHTIPQAQATPKPEPRPPSPWQPKPCEVGWFQLDRSTCITALRAFESDTYLVRVDLKDPNVNVRPELVAGQEQTGTMKSAAERAQALIAANASFFDRKTGHILGPIAGNGEWLNVDIFPQWVLMWYAKDPANATLVQSELAVQLDVKNIQLMVSGTPALIANGNPVRDFGPDNDAQILYGRHPRTAVGVDADGNLFLVIIDGRRKDSAGATLPDLAQFMGYLGMKNAVNFDGGGSTELVVKGQVINHPSDGTERPVALMLVVEGKNQNGSP